jgi:hypothetical protein
MLEFRAFAVAAAVSALEPHFRRRDLPQGPSVLRKNSTTVMQREAGEALLVRSPVPMGRGIGIDAKTAEQLFSAFFTTKPSGMGMDCRSEMLALLPAKTRPSFT